MNKRYIFGNLAPERRTAMVEENENKEFLKEIRTIMEGRGVQGAELTIPTAKPDNWEPNAPEWSDLHSTNIITLNIFDKTGTDFFASLATAFGVASGKRSWKRVKVCAMNEKTIIDIKARALATNSAGLVMVGVNNIMPGFDGVIVEDNNLADYDILFDYFDVFNLVERSGATMKRYEQTLALKDQTLFIGGARYDGKPVFGEAFGIVNYNNTAPTTTATFAADEANVDLVKLSNLVLGAANSPITLHPAFDPNVLNYSATVTSHSTKVSASALKTDATVAIKIGDSTSVTNGSNATTEAGNNVLTIDVTNGNAAKRTYTVTISDETT